MRKRLATTIILDSGAYSAWRLGSEIDIGAYAEFLEEHRGLYSYAANLDVIPGKFGKPPTLKEVDESAQQSYENLQFLSRRGIPVMGIFHQGEDFRWLEWMIDEGYDYIGVSPDNGKMIAQKREWMDRVFDHITVDGYPIVKTHGFAVTSIDMILRYPWASVDSATWIQLGAFGGTFVPRYGANGFMYERSPYAIQVSSTDSSSLRNGNHFYNFSKAMQARIEEFFNSEGFDLKDVEDTFEARSVICLRVLKRLQENLSVSKFQSGSPQLFGAPKSFADRFSPIHVDKKLIYYAISCAAVYSDMLTVEGLDRRLITYHILRDKDSAFLPFYARTGVFPKGKTWKRWVDADALAESSLEHVEITRTDSGQDRSKVSTRSEIATDMFGNEQVNTRKRNWKRT